MSLPFPSSNAAGLLAMPRTAHGYVHSRESVLSSNGTYKRREKRLGKTPNNCCNYGLFKQLHDVRHSVGERAGIAHRAEPGVDAVPSQ